MGINCIDPRFLADETLRDEYERLPLILHAAFLAMRNGDKPDDPRTLVTYVPDGYDADRFFYAKLIWVKKRFRQVVRELCFRGLAVDAAFLESPGFIPKEWWNDWQPSEAERLLCLCYLDKHGGINYAKALARYMEELP